MAIDYQRTAKMLVDELGGQKNITNVTHCATRLRFTLRDEDKVNKNAVNRIPGVITTVSAGGQLQVVIGNHVGDAYKFVTELVETDAAAASNKRVGVFSRIIDVISGIFAPFLYTLAACGILQGILGIFVALDAIDTEGGTYQILNFISWTAFTFLPVLIAITASKKFGLNTFVGTVIACALVCPDYIEMTQSDEAVYFLGMKVSLLSYTSSVIPIILAIWIASYIERFWNRVLPIVVRSLFSAMFTIVIMVPLTLLAFGPVGSVIGNAIGGIYNFLYGLSPIAAGVIVGGLWEVLVIFGVHWGITPVTVGNYANLGYDTFTGLQASAVFSQAGAALGVCLKTKSREMKKVSASAAVTGLFGITEPAIYGVNLRFKKPMVCGCIAGAVGGAVAGAFNSVSWSYNMPGIATLPAYFKAGHMTQFLGLLLSVAISFVLGAVLTYIVGFEDEENPQEVHLKDAPSQLEIASPVSGRTIPLSEVSDEAFASGDLGQGVAISPNGDTIYAPFDCKIEMLAESGHAVGLMSSDGISLLIHVGIDTVRLGGRGFERLVSEGDEVKSGEAILRFDRELLNREGYDSTVIIIATELSDSCEVFSREGSDVKSGDAILSIQSREVKE